VGSESGKEQDMKIDEERMQELSAGVQKIFEDAVNPTNRLISDGNAEKVTNDQF
jgi:hypothetical protein